MPLFAAAGLAADLPDAGDHPLLKRFGGAEIVGYDVKRFDEYELQTSSYKRYDLQAKRREFVEPPLKLEGGVTRIWYEVAGKASSAELAGNYRNELKAQHEARTSLQTQQPVQVEIDYRLVRQLVRLFDENGRLIRWPKKFTQRMLCLWVLWSRLPARTVMTEREISDWLQERHCFGDHALLRRELVDRRFVTRTPDGRVYTRIEQRPPTEAAALFEQLRK
jgi:hypothetical protein